MIALDTNVIVHYLVSSQREHARVRAWFESVAEPLATTPTNLGEVLRLLTHPRVFPSPLPLREAARVLQEFVERLDVTIALESEDWLDDLRELTEALPNLRGNEVFDARIALSLRHNGIRRICTFDSDFQMYPFLTVVTPDMTPDVRRLAASRAPRSRRRGGHQLPE